MRLKWKTGFTLKKSAKVAPRTRTCERGQYISLVTVLKQLLSTRRKNENYMTGDTAYEFVNKIKMSILASLINNIN